MATTIEINSIVERVSVIDPPGEFKVLDKFREDWGEPWIVKCVCLVDWMEYRKGDEVMCYLADVRIKEQEQS